MRIGLVLRHRTNKSVDQQQVSVFFFFPGAKGVDCKVATELRRRWRVGTAWVLFSQEDRGRGGESETGDDNREGRGE